MNVIQNYKMRLSVLIILLFISVSFCTNSFAQIPENLEQCNAYLDKKLKKKEIEEIKNLNEDELSKLHFGLGLYIRNYWLREKGFEKLNTYFHELGLLHYDDVSSLIIKNYWYYLNNKKLDIDKEISAYKDYYKQAAIEQELREKKQKNVENLIRESITELNVIQQEVPIIEIPQRDLNVFCNEFIHYGNGIIINSLITYPSNPDIGINYNYYYLDLVTKNVKKLKCEQLDIIESIIVRDNQLYISGKKNNESIILISSNGHYEEIQTLSNDSLQIGNSSWIKLGFYNDKLIALQKDGVYLLEDSIWQHYYKFSLDSLNKENGIARAKSIIPTENIKIVNDKLYFVQEIVQGRSSNLIEVDLTNKTVTDFFSKIGLIDNMQKTVYTYYVDSNSNIYITGNRLMNQNLYLKSNNKEFETIIFNNKVKTGVNSDYLVRPRISINKKNCQLIIAENGIFNLSERNIKPILQFENQDKRFGYYSCKFKPRAYSEFGDDKILLGGMYGGIALIDLKTSETEWLDEDKIDVTMEIFDLK